MINVSSVSSKSQATNSGGNGAIMKKKYMVYFSHFNEKQDIDINLNKDVIVETGKVVMDLRITFVFKSFLQLLLNIFDVASNVAVVLLMKMTLRMKQCIRTFINPLSVLLSK